MELNIWARSRILSLALVLSFGALGAPSNDPPCLGVTLSNLLQQTTVEGPRITIKAEAGARSFDQIKELKVATYNVLNLVEMQGARRTDPVTGVVHVIPRIAKNPLHLQTQGKMILDADLDVIFMEEVEDIKVLDLFANNNLGGKYKSILIEGNDGRGIDIGILVKKDLPFDLTVQSHRELLNQAGEKVFSRDLPVMEVRKSGAAPNSDPLMTFMGTHFKSKRDSPGDPMSVAKRTEQATTTAQVLKGLESKYGAHVPIVLLGDFNTDVRGAPELSALWQAGLKDGFDIKGGVAPQDRVTHTFHPQNAPAQWAQLDAQCLSTSAQCQPILKEIKVVRYLDAAGQVKPIPRSFRERDQNPSDHFMVYANYDFEKIKSLARAAPTQSP